MRRTSLGLSVLVTLVFAILIQVYYTSGELRGSFSKFFLAADMFGVPAHLKEKGIEPYSYNPVNTGWDGQFYYYIANDLFDRKGTSAHIDSPSYRYQRIGLPLAARGLAFLTGSKWVSPLTFYLTSLIAILAATFILGRYLQSRGVSAFWSLLWSMGIGTQLTLSRGLPDAFADACLIIGLIGFMEQWRKIWILPFLALACLSREIYIVIPGFLFGALFLLNVFQEKKKFLVWMKENVYLLIPIFLYGSWQIFLRQHFAGTPGQAALAGGILDFVPFRTWLRMFLGSMNGTHPLKDTYEWKPLFSYLILYGLTALTLVIVLFKKVRNREALVILSFLPILGLYACFGQTVMHHFSGYFKAATIFYFICLLGFPYFSVKLKLVYQIALVLLSLSPTKVHLGMVRFYPSSVYFNDYGVYRKNAKVAGEIQNCENLNLNAKLLDVSDFSKNPWISALLNQSPVKVLKVEITSNLKSPLNLVTGNGQVVFKAVQVNPENDQELFSLGTPVVLQEALEPQKSQIIELPIIFNRKENFAWAVQAEQKNCANEKKFGF